MYGIKYLTRIVSYFLPRQATIFKIEGYYTTPALVEGDLDGDGKTEVVGIYERNKELYVIILKNENNRWNTLWNNKIGFKSISKLQITKLENKEKKQLVIGGITKEDDVNKFMILQLEDDELRSLIETPICFDKVYIQDVDGTDGIEEVVIWVHRKLEAYDVNIYRYEGNKLIEDRTLEMFYFNEVVNYYKFLQVSYPDEELYKTYLTEAERRYKGIETSLTTEKAEEFQEEAEEFEEEVEETKESLLNRSGILLALTVYIEDVSVEEDVYIVGERHSSSEGTSYVEDMKLIVTNANKSGYWVINISAEKIYDYRVFIGDFTGNGLEDIFIRIKGDPNSDKSNSCIYSAIGGGLVQVFNSHEPAYRGGNVIYEPHYKVRVDFDEKEYSIDLITRGKAYLARYYKDTGELKEESKGSIGGECISYPADENLLGQYNLYCRYKILGEQSEDLLGYIGIWLKWEDEGFVAYRKYIEIV